MGKEKKEEEGHGEGGSVQYKRGRRGKRGEGNEPKCFIRVRLCQQPCVLPLIIDESRFEEEQEEEKGEEWRCF